MVWLALAVLLMAQAGEAQVRTFVLGQSAHPWERGGDGIDPVILVGTPPVARPDSGNAPDKTVEFGHRPGWISPRFFPEEANISGLVLEKGGEIRSPNSLSVSASLVRAQLEGIVNGDHEVAFERKPTPFNLDVPAFGIWVTMTFPRLVGIHRIRFYPRNTAVPTPRKPFQDDFLRGYELWINDQRTTNSQAGAPDALVARVGQNEEPVVEVEVDPQYVRQVKLRSLSEVPFEIDEIEVYGTGYLDQATYYSDLIDLGQRSSLGAVRWAEEVVGEAAFSQVEVKMRTGSDPTPIVFRKGVPSPNGTIATVISAEQYWAIDPVKGNPLRLPLLPDDEHWTPWKPVEEGAPSPAVGPWRYAQFQVQFRGRIFDTRELDRLELDYLQPPIADTLRAEVYPRLAEAEKPASFRYAVRLRAAGTIRGYDRLEVDTNVPVGQVHDLALNGTPVDSRVESSDERGFRLALPLVIQDQSLLEFTFDLPIFRFGTTFSGRVYNSRFPTLPQQLEPGQAVQFGPGDFDELSGLSVSIPKKQIGKLVGEISFNTRVLTPNGDGVNDRLEIFFNLLQLVAPAPVSLEIFDLAGRRVRTVFAADLGIGPAQYRWDGRLAGGELAAPGNYLWVLRVRADAFEERHSGVVAVGY
jgi:hypothetical protein